MRSAMLVLVGRTDLPGGAEAGLAQAGLRGEGGAPRVGRMGAAEVGLGAPRALDWGTKVLVTLLLLIFSRVCVWGGPFSTVGVGKWWVV